MKMPQKLKKKKTKKDRKLEQKQKIAKFPVYGEISR